MKAFAFGTKLDCKLRMVFFFLSFPVYPLEHKSAFTSSLRVTMPSSVWQRCECDIMETRGIRHAYSIYTVYLMKSCVAWNV